MGTGIGTGMGTGMGTAHVRDLCRTQALVSYRSADEVDFAGNILEREDALHPKSRSH